MTDQQPDTPDTTDNPDAVERTPGDPASDVPATFGKGKGGPGGRRGGHGCGGW